GGLSPQGSLTFRQPNPQEERKEGSPPQHSRVTVAALLHTSFVTRRGTPPPDPPLTPGHYSGPQPKHTPLPQNLPHSPTCSPPAAPTFPAPLALYVRTTQPSIGQRVSYAALPFVDWKRLDSSRRPLAPVKRRAVEMAAAAGGTAQGRGATSFQRKAADGSRLATVVGTRPSVRHGQLLLSSGLPSLDCVLGGGIAVGTLLLIEEDKYALYSNLLFKYFLAEGVVCGHDLFVASAKEHPDNILKERSCEARGILSVV
uniref:Elongator complex protein 4 n=1 Tax=Melopsittacus undulatus TaxID=13146 RepID=A0A8V5FL01_MELUD